MKTVEPFYDGLEVGSVSVKWVRTDREGRATASVLIRHDGNPAATVLEILGGHRTSDTDRGGPGRPPTVITGQSTRALLSLPYRSETECLERALAHLDVRPDILLSLGGESFVVYSMRESRRDGLTLESIKISGLTPTSVLVADD